MRKLLQEAAKIQARAHDHLMELSAKLPMQYFGLVDSGIIQDLGNLMGRIIAALAAPEPDAMEVLRKVREEGQFNDGTGKKIPPNSFALPDSEAAALIESYGRRVPRAWGEMTDDEQANLAQRIKDYLAAPSESEMELVRKTEAVNNVLSIKS